MTKSEKKQIDSIVAQTTKLKEGLGTMLPIASYQFKSHLNLVTLRTNENATLKEVYKEHARQIWLIYEVSAFEIFCKEFIIDSKNNSWNEEGMHVLLEEKYSLGEAYHIFKGKEISREGLIAHFNTFQNLYVVEKIFNALVNGSIIQKVNNYYLERIRVANDPIIYFETEKAIRENLHQIFETRHRIVHECSVENLVYTDVLKFGSILDMFAIMITRFCMENKF